MHMRDNDNNGMRWIENTVIPASVVSKYSWVHCTKKFVRSYNVVCRTSKMKSTIYFTFIKFIVWVSIYEYDKEYDTKLTNNYTKYRWETLTLKRSVCTINI